MKSKELFSKLLLLLFLTLLLSSACVKKEAEVDHEAAAKLFEKSLKLISAYTDSLRNAPDSAKINRLSVIFEQKINNLNFEFPPNTDFNLTEEENDSLIKVTEKMVICRREMLESYAKKTLDSIPAMDTIPILPSHNLHN